MSDEENEDEAEDDLRIPVHQYLNKGTLPADVKEARKLESKAAIYSLRDGILYRRSFLGPMMRCLSRTKGRRILHDIHSGDAGNHSGRRSLAIKAKMQGYYWLSMDKDSKNVDKRCERFQRFSRKIKSPATELNSVISPCPFVKWGVDIVGPLIEGTSKRKYLIVATVTSPSGWKQRLWRE
ncbi:uncharacterized protein LOC113272432 [Papaver somniferum]|uniref:uncharacterized protein LOC113272432 n=1 Tax=Papaver somniferum TaxID=3469 RepID=UPI000E6F9BDD|nr:uncharacterized protein LOC113272432 [Papaver somniferum]